MISYLVKRGKNHVTVDKGWYSVELYSGHLKNNLTSDWDKI